MLGSLWRQVLERLAYWPGSHFCDFGGLIDGRFARHLQIVDSRESALTIFDATWYPTTRWKSGASSSVNGFAGTDRLVSFLEREPD